ncbi:MAG: hypothetical protein ACI8PZ_004451 [Myxococcota bacterium]|jgi:hypothetical protein
MRSILALALLLPGSALAVDITVSGACPGPLTFSMTGISPGGQVAVLTANSPGLSAVPAGPCAGAELPLDPRGLSLRVIRTDADADGMDMIMPAVPAPACGLYVTALDLTTCEAAEPMMIPEAGPIDATLYAAVGSGGGSGLFAIDTATGAVTPMADPGVPITGMAADGAGNLYVIQGGGLGVGNPNAGAIAMLDAASGALAPVALTAQIETSLEWADGTLFAADENTQYASIDPATGAVTVLPGLPDGTSYGFALAWDGAQMWRLNDTDLQMVDPDGSSLTVAAISGLPGGNGGGATVHEGQLWGAFDDGAGGTGLFIIDTLTGAATYSGISIPVDSIDALASTTP